jgi:restriction endonuclease Mrr
VTERNGLAARVGCGIPVVRASHSDTASRAVAADMDMTTIDLMGPEITADLLRSELLALPELAPHARGFAFEKFLTRLFRAHGLRGRGPFRNRGEQIDGSFQLGQETYLLEAKWQAAPVGASALHTFHGKIEQKAAWARGLFVSNSGYTEEGLEAFGRAKRLVCMDGLDLYELLQRGLSLAEVLERKIRWAAETGRPFVRLRELYL